MRSGASPVLGFFGSTLGQKVVMAVTGVIGVGFLFVHMSGNLLAYLGPTAFNAYSEFLRHFLHGAGLWIARFVLLGAVVLHVWAAVALTLKSRAARSVSYRRQSWTESTYASRTMRWSGPLLLLFIVYHLLHFTTGDAHPNFIPGDAYANFVTGFRSVPASAAYIVAMLALGLHLYHGAWSMLQTLGLSHPRYNAARHALATLVTFLVVGANLSFPIAVLTGVIR
jgi:succinate dehydrogenase / fumarate reductase cytochrome b subunit